MKLNFKHGDVTLPDGQEDGAQYLADLVVNRGVNAEDGVEIDWNDMVDLFVPNKRSAHITDSMSAGDIHPLLSVATEIIMREPLEPLTVINGLFTPIKAKGLTTQVLAGAIGGDILVQDVPEGSTYPESHFQLGGALQTAIIGKVGLQASFTDEALRYSTWDVFAINLRMMGRALAMHREAKGAAFLTTLGTTLYDNANPTNSLFGVCTGRGLDMAANGSMSIDDLFQGMAHMAEEGFNPDTLLLNPLFFYMWLQDQTLRNMLLAHGGGSYFQHWTGEAGPRDPWSNGAMGAMGPSSGNRITPANSPAGGAATGVSGREHGMTAAPQVPSYFPWPFRVMVSPLVPFDAENLTGNIILLKSGDVGFYLEDEAVVRADWRDESTDIAKVKLRERYGYAVAHEGQSVGVYRNVKLARNRWDGSLTPTVTGPSSEIDASTAVV